MTTPTNIPICLLRLSHSGHIPDGKQRRRRWHRAVLVWGLLKHKANGSGIITLDKKTILYLEENMNLKERSIQGHVKVAVEKGLLGVHPNRPNTYFIRSAKSVCERYKLSKRCARYYIGDDWSSFIYAAVVASIYGYFRYWARRRKLGHQQAQMVGVSHSMAMQALGISLAYSSLMRKACMAQGLMHFKREYEVTPYTLWDIDHLRQLEDTRTLIVSGDQVLGCLTSSISDITIEYSFVRN